MYYFYPKSLKHLKMLRFKSRKCLFIPIISTLLLLMSICSIHLANGDIATDCYGSDASQFPTSNLFGAAGDGIWDGGASCGRQYLVRCISATEMDTCVPDKTIQIKIVDYGMELPSLPALGGTTFVLSDAAFAAIAKSSATFINIEFQQV